MTKARDLAVFNAAGVLTSTSNLNADKLTSGTIPNARYGTPTFNGSNLTSLTPANLDDTGTIPSALLAGVGGGITEVDQWVVTSNFSGDANPLTTNWARMTGFEKIGTGMTESSGVFTFPSTGVYLVHFQTSFGNNTGDDRNIGTHIELYDGTSYNSVGTQEGALARNSGSTWYGNQTVRAVVDITDTAVNTLRVKVSTMLDQTNWQCEANTFKTGLQFIRLGDT